MDDIEDFFGDKSFYDYSIVVFTRKHEIFLNESNKSIEDFVEKKTVKPVQNMVKLCGNRVIAVENVGEGRKISSEEIREFIEVIIESHKGAYYSHNYFELLKDIEQERKELEKGRKELERQKTKMEELEATLKRMTIEKKGGCNIL